MYIASLSMSISQIQVAQQASISVMKMAMDKVEVQAVDITQKLEANTKIMEGSMNPNLGGNIDISL